MEAVKEELYTGVRGLYLMLLFMPVLMLSPICAGLGWGWHSWVELLRWTLERAGPAFIKWGQVSDLFKSFSAFHCSLWGAADSVARLPGGLNIISAAKGEAISCMDRLCFQPLQNPA